VLKLVRFANQQGAAGLHHAGHFVDWRLQVGDVDQRQVADDQIERVVLERQALGRRLEIHPTSIARACRGDERRRRIDSDGFDAMGGEHPGEPALAAPDVERGSRRLRERTRKHHRVEHVTAAEVAMSAHVGHPGSRRTLPAIFNSGHCHLRG
jgi:hypothetical protein